MGVVFLECEIHLLLMDKKITTMGNIDFKHLGLTVVAVIVALAVYDRFVAPMIDKAVD